MSPPDKHSVTATEDTLAVAVQRAENWLCAHIDDAGLSRTPRQIEQALLRYAQDVCGSTWRTLRSCVARQQEAQGFPDTAKRLRKLANPVPLTERKSRPRRCKSVDNDSFEKLRKGAQHKEDWELAAALDLAAITGCRPAEMRRIQITTVDNERWELRIPGAKRRADRGIDERVIQIDKAMAPELDKALQWISPLDDQQFRAVQDRLRRLAKKLFPRRAVRPSLYSFRHQLGSDAKADPQLSDMEVAAMMGHISVQSVCVYGDRRQGKGQCGVRVSPETVAKVTPGVRLRGPLHQMPGTAPAGTPSS